MADNMRDDNGEQASGTAGEVMASAMSHATSAPHDFIVCWVDYSSKYGVGYLTSSGTVGVVFNDDSRIVLAPSRSHFMYTPMPTRRNSATSTGSNHNSNNNDSGASRTATTGVLYRSGDTLPEDRDLNKKATLLWHFEKYLVRSDSRGLVYSAQSEGRKGTDRALALREAAAAAAGKGGNISSMEQPAFDVDLSTVGQAKKWLKTKHAMVFRLNNKAIQVEFLDGSGLVLASRGSDMTYTDRKGATQYLSLNDLPDDVHLLKRLRYTKDLLSQLVDAKA